jgi:hypothetical protein
MDERLLPRANPRKEHEKTHYKWGYGDQRGNYPLPLDQSMMMQSF